MAPAFGAAFVMRLIPPRPALLSLIWFIAIFAINQEGYEVVHSFARRVVRGSLYRSIILRVMIVHLHSSSRNSCPPSATRTICQRMLYAVEEGTFRMKHWPGSNNVADIFTKWLPRNTFQRYRSMLLNLPAQRKLGLPVDDG